MGTFRRERQLRKAIEDVLKEAMNDIAIQVRDEMKTILMTEWYMRGDYKPSEKTYERTWELYDSITAEPVKNSKGGLSVHIFFDLSKIHAYKNEFGFNAHMSLGGQKSYGSKSGGVSRKPIKAWLIEWINDGNSGSVGNNPIQGIHLFEQTDKFIDNNLDRIMRSVFREYGLYLSKI